MEHHRIDFMDREYVVYFTPLDAVYEVAGWTEARKLRTVWRPATGRDPSPTVRQIIHTARVKRAALALAKAVRTFAPSGADNDTWPEVSALETLVKDPAR